MASRSLKRISAKDLYRFELITECRISPDGEFVVYVVQRVDRESEKKYSNVWVIGADGRGRRQFTHGDQQDLHPRWSPDGSSIAFISNRTHEKQPQLYIIPFHGGEARMLTTAKGSFKSLSWSPDGKYILVEFRKKDADEIAREKDEDKKKLGIVSRDIQRTFYKLDGEGFLPDEKWHLWLVNASTGKMVQLTDDNRYDEWDPCWMPDSDGIVFCSNHSSEPDHDPDNDDLFMLSTKKGITEHIETPLGPKRLPSINREGTMIAYVGHEGRGDWWKNERIFIVPVDGSTVARDLTGAFDIHVSSWTINDMGSPIMMQPTWSTDSKTLYFQATIHGNTTLSSISLTGNDLVHIIEHGVVGSFTFDADGDRIAFILGDMSDPGQIYVCGDDKTRPRKISNANSRLLRSVDLGTVDEVWFEGNDGNRLQGWILKPPGFDPDALYPSILEIHGGPLVQYGDFFMHEFYYLASHGYVVYFSNPRGGQGYGEKHARAIWGCWGTKDYEDLMVWTDYVAGLPYIDTARMGVTGGSYGGFMTNWIIGHTDRFRAAVTQRSVSNMSSMWGSSDFNWIFQQELGDKPPWEDIENYWNQSPMKFIGNTKTPTLVIHSEKDFRCAYEQGEQVYIALRRLGVETEFVLFPDEPHGLSRGGRTDRRIARLNHILRWFNRYLKS